MTDQNQHSPAPGTSRRAVLLGAGGLGAAGILSACTASSTDRPAATGTAPETDPATTAPVPATAGGQRPQPGAIKTADIPVGSGIIIKDKNVVITQPTKGTFKAFTATCTHMGCQLAAVRGGTIDCSCHGSQYSVVDGSVKRGPATRRLAEKAVDVADGMLSV